MVGEPFQGASYGRAIDDARPNPRKAVPKVKRRQRVSVPTSHPAQTCCHAPKHDEELGSKLVHQPALEGNKPSLQENEHGEGDLDERQFLVQVGR